MKNVFIEIFVSSLVCVCIVYTYRQLFFLSLSAFVSLPSFFFSFFVSAWWWYVYVWWWWWVEKQHSPVFFSWVYMNESREEEEEEKLMLLVISSNDRVVHNVDINRNRHVWTTNWLNCSLIISPDLTLTYLLDRNDTRWWWLSIARLCALASICSSSLRRCRRLLFLLVGEAFSFPASTRERRGKRRRRSKKREWHFTLHIHTHTHTMISIDIDWHSSSDHCRWRIPISMSMIAEMIDNQI